MITKSSPRKPQRLTVHYVVLAYICIGHVQYYTAVANCIASGSFYLCFFHKSYLHNRIQCVSVNSYPSSNLPVLSGVPQGSILGLQLFLVFIINLPSAIASQSLAYCDDTKCYWEISSLCEITHSSRILTFYQHGPSVITYCLIFPNLCLWVSTASSPLSIPSIVTPYHYPPAAKIWVSSFNTTEGALWNDYQ